MKPRDYITGVPAAGHLTGTAHWHPGALSVCRQCNPPKDPSITCPVCGRTSYNPNDVEQGYCGYCHDWTRKEKR